MKRYETFLEGLSANQREAATIGRNAVIAAGAGSGKTRVLAARFVHLVVNEGIPVESILALTFTRKAAAEMYARIHSTLREIDHPLARAATENFHRARITTLDSFSGSIARHACRSYGVTPDFSTDATEVSRMAEELALPFFLERRKTEAVRRLTRRFRMAELPAKLFAETMVRHSTISSPLDFARFFSEQRAMTLARIESLAREIVAIADAMRSNAGATKSATDVIAAIPEDLAVPDPSSATGVADFCDALGSLASRQKLRPSKDPAASELREIFADFKDRLYPSLLAAANWVFNERVIKETLDLLAEFQEAFNRRKRETGLLTFGDVARMAVDALKSDPDLRRAWKESIRSVMIDEFQDDNDLQRDLLFLIAERPERTDGSVPAPDELVEGKLFFVGDEKQSIYRFRGADVSVFRKLAGELTPKQGTTPALDANYRTERALIDSFNALFPHVFPATIADETGKRPLYEAEFAPIVAASSTEEVECAFDILLVPKENFDGDDPSVLSPEETEAREIALRIRAIVLEGTPVADKDKRARPCRYGDVAILLRSGTNQRAIERQLREAGVPYQTENVRGLFDDAPVNDLYCLLRLAAYPADTTAYAALLRSPFVGIGDEGFARALLARVEADAEGRAIPEPFAEDIEPFLAERDRILYSRARELYRSVRADADRIPAAELVTRLWHREGYRYALYSDYGLERYAELYDYFFELARQADADGIGLAAFLDRVGELMKTGEKIDSLDVPVDQSGGVTIMTVHKSKGLEFPVVFVADAGSEGNRNGNANPVYFSEEGGISVNTGASEENEDARDNWFYERERDAELRREIAETRRLLYVAMTRAGSRLVVSGTLNLGMDPAAEPRGDDELMDSIAAWLEKRDERGSSPKRQSFLRMLLTAVLRERCAGMPAPLVTVEEILPRKRESSNAGSGFLDRTADPETALRHAGIPVAEYRPSPRTRYSATDLGGDDHEKGAKSNEEESARRAGSPAGDDRLDALLRKAKIDAAEFGTWAHRAIEARLTGVAYWVPEEFRPLAEEMADRFLSSELGKRALAAEWSASEYGFLTRYPLGERIVTVTGQMDLAFEAGGIAYVVDYKTDRVEDPAAHESQLAVYRKAIADLRGRPAETWLFYLRSGNAVRVG